MTKKTTPVEVAYYIQLVVPKEATRITFIDRKRQCGGANSTIRRVRLPRSFGAAVMSASQSRNNGGKPSVTVMCCSESFETEPCKQMMRCNDQPRAVLRNTRCCLSHVDRAPPTQYRARNRIRRTCALKTSKNIVTIQRTIVNSANFSTKTLKQHLRNGKTT